MTRNNNIRYNIIINMNNKFDFDTFVEECTKQKVQPMSQNEFFQKVGMLHWAINKYPDKDPLEAYLELTAYLNSKEPDYTKVAIVSNSGCGSCGGGKVV